jgi:hypothetical protein
MDSPAAENSDEFFLWWVFLVKKAPYFGGPGNNFHASLNEIICQNPSDFGS